MTDRIDGPRAPRPTAPAAAPGAGKAAASAEVGKLAATGLDTRSARAALAAVGGAALPAAPGLALDVGAAAKEVRSFGRRLLDFFGEDIPNAFQKVVVRPLQDLAWGAGQKLEFLDKDAFPTAKAESWRGKPADLPWTRDPVEDKAVAALIAAELADTRDTTDPDHGLPPARAAAARALAAKIRAAFGPTGPGVFADPQRLAAIAARGADALAATVPPEDHPLAALQDLPGPIGGALAAVRVAMTTAVQDGLVKRIEKVERLDAATRARFDALRGTFADSPRVQEALDGLAADMKLTKVAAGGGTLLDHLEAIATGPLDKSVEAERRDLLGEVILEVRQSGSVAQRGMNTCGATTASAHLCYMDPAEYARLVAGLASPAGAVKTANGVALKRDEKWDLDVDTQSKTQIQRTLSGRLLQPAIMDVGAMNEYDNETDEDRTWVARMGTKPAGVERQLEALTGKNWDWTSTTTGIGRNQVADLLKGASLEHPVVVAMNYNDEGEVMPAFHWIRVVGFDAAQDAVVIRNTQRGTEERIAYDEFRQRMFYAVHERDD